MLSPQDPLYEPSDTPPVSVATPASTQQASTPAEKQTASTQMSMPAPVPVPVPTPGSAAAHARRLHSNSNANSYNCNNSYTNSYSFNNNNNNNNTPSNSSSAIDIFERNVQQDADRPLSMSPTSSSASASANASVSASLPPFFRHQHRTSSLSILCNNNRPSHLISEDFTSPVLDSTVELISSKKFNDFDLVEVPHCNTKENLFKNSSSSSNSFTGRRNTLSNTTSPPQSATSATSPPQLIASPINSPSGTLSPHRKSISFYSYLDLINFEKNSEQPPSIPAQVESQFPNQPPLSRRQTLQGVLEDANAKIDEELTESENELDPVENSDLQSIQSWVPPSPLPLTESSTFNHSLSRRTSLVQELASLKSCTTNNSYFEDQLNTNDESSFPPIVNVCSATDYISEKSKQLRDCCRQATRNTNTLA